MPLNYHKLLIAHVVETLPQDIGERRRLIEALIYCMPSVHTAQKDLRQLLFHLDRHILAQTELALTLDQANSTATNDTDPNDNSGHRRKAK